MRKLSLNEGMFKDLDKTIVSVDDPDYEQKVKDQTFNDFRQADINIQKSIIEDWILNNITLCEHYKPNGYGSKWVKLSENDRNTYYYIDNNLEIHLLSPKPAQEVDMYTVYKIREGLSIFSDDSPNNPNNKSHKELPYKITECQASLMIDGSDHNLFCELESLKNLPETIGLENYHTLFWVTKTHIKSLEGCPKIINCTYFDVSQNELESLKGCPKKILNFADADISGFNAANNHITSLAGGPESVNGFFNVGGNLLSNLKNGPTIVTRNYYASHNPIVSLDGAPAEIKESFFCNYIGSEVRPLYNLVGAPRTIGGKFQISHSGLLSLVGGPMRINGEFDVSHNKLTSLEDGPNYVGVTYNAANNPLNTIKGIENTHSSNGWATLDITECRLIPYSEIKDYHEKPGHLHEWRVKYDSDLEFATDRYFSLNEGLFKDLDDKIVSVDDPDYEQKIKDQTFTDFQKSDLETRQFNTIEQWIWSHVYVSFRSQQTGVFSSTIIPLAEKDEGILYRIKQIDDIFYIDLLGDKESCYYIVKLNPDETELPYPFDICQGSTFRLTRSNLSSLKNIPRECNYMDLSGNNITSFAGMPKVHVKETLELSTNKITDFKGFPEDCSIDTLRVTYADMASFNGFPESITIDWLDLHHNNILSFKGLPDNLIIGRSLNLSENSIKNFDDFPDKIYIGLTLDLSKNNLTTAYVPRSLIMQDTENVGKYVGTIGSMIKFENNPEITRDQIPGPAEKIPGVLYHGLGKNLNNY